MHACEDDGLPRQTRPGMDVSLQAYLPCVKRKRCLHREFDSGTLPAGHSEVS